MVKNKRYLGLLALSFLGSACSNDSSSGFVQEAESLEGSRENDGAQEGTQGQGEQGSEEEGSKTPKEDSGSTASSDSENPEEGIETPGTAPRFDVSSPDQPTEEEEKVPDCSELSAGLHCQDFNTVIECDGAGRQTSIEHCAPDVCQEGKGCVLCREGTFGCQGDRVMACDTSTPQHSWQEIEKCRPEFELCDQETGACVSFHAKGGTEPTGYYFKYAEFSSEDFPRLARSYNIDTVDFQIQPEGKRNYRSLIYVSFEGENGVNTRDGVSEIDVYEVNLLDSDGDGVLEPEQHPESEENRGPIEERTLSFVETIRIEGAPHVYQHRTEIYALEDRLYFIARATDGTIVVEYDLESRRLQQVTAPFYRYYNKSISHLGYDDVHGIWYAGTESPIYRGGDNRYVYQYDPRSESWGVAFGYPPLAGGHMDGMEVVTDPNTGTPYIYVSDMTSDFIGQYRLDLEKGWVQENLFVYDGPEGAAVEGMGHGAMGHFWVTAGRYAPPESALYEIGGGSLGKYTVPIE